MAEEVTELVIVGAGPAGLAAASAARRAGIRRVIVVDREQEAGGIPRHCCHSPFGMREFRRLLRGPSYARRLVARARRDGAEIWAGTHVVRLEPGGKLVLATQRGAEMLIGSRVILATGARETPRSARLVPGDRSLGILTTGALQAFVHLERLLPFRRPVIVGTELVGFSAVLTSLASGIRPVAMIELGPHVVARWPCVLLPRLAGVELIYRARILDVFGHGRVEGIAIATPSGDRRIACDGLLFTGEFGPAAELARQSHLALDPGSGGPIVDQFGRCSDPAYFAAGNLLRPVETAGWCWAEGDRVGRDVARDLAGTLPKVKRPVFVIAGEAIKFSVPQRLVPGALDGGLGALQLRVTGPAKGWLRLKMGEGKVSWGRRIAARPERRILLPLAGLALRDDVTSITVGIEDG
jgi:NADPH-dependent 2,4-dienoyl-CoA reductase/sulfur reductase-like enzyme